MVNANRIYEISRHVITDCRIVYALGEVFANVNHMKHLTSLVDIDSDMSLEDKEETKLKLELGSNEELKELMNHIRKTIGTENILGVDNVSAEGVTIIEYGYKSLQDFQTYTQKMDEDVDKKFIEIKTLDKK